MPIEETERPPEVAPEAMRLLFRFGFMLVVCIIVALIWLFWFDGGWLVFGLVELFLVLMGFWNSQSGGYQV